MNIFTLYTIAFKKYIWLYLLVIVFIPLVVAIPFITLWLEKREEEIKAKHMEDMLRNKKG